jgi:glutamate N-acetyltransferase/amino-acid N-acetyltransferase
MIRPDMATMLAFVLTDAAASPAALGRAVAAAAEQSFNRATVDGDMSTNDTLLLWASGRAGNPALEPGEAELAPLVGAVTRVCQELAAMLVADGEGAGHLVRVVVSGAPDHAAARRLAYAIAHSPLCKTAFAGQDPNWGRLLSAAGAEAARAGLPFAAQETRLWIGEALIAEAGLYAGPDAERAAARAMRRPRYQVHLEAGSGPGEFWLLTSDLDTTYIKINADYRS